MIRKEKQTGSLNTKVTDVKSSKNTKSLQIVVSKGKTISKTQKEFNRLNKIIVSLKKQIEEIPLKKQLINNFYISDIQDIEKIAQASNLEHLALLDTIYEKEKLAAWRKKKLACIILEECMYIQSVFVNLDSQQTETCKSIFYKYNLIVNNQTREELEKEELLILADLASGMFNIDAEELENITNEKDMINFIQQKMHETDNNHDTTNTTEPTQKKKLTKAQLKEDAQAAIIQKSLREIYTDLVKELHPDREQNDILRKEKEEKMKQITEAYQKKDLSALLLMQINWLLKTDKDPAEQPTAVLKQYNQILQKQIIHLEKELDTLQIYNVPFNPIENYNLLLFNLKELKTKLNKCKTNLINLIESFNEQKRLLSLKAKKNKNEFIDLYELEDIYDDVNDFDDDFDDDFENEFDEFNELQLNIFGMFLEEIKLPNQKKASKKR